MADDSVRTEQLRELTISDRLDPESTDESAELQLVATGEFQRLLVEPVEEQCGDEDGGNEGFDPYNRT